MKEMLSPNKLKAFFVRVTLDDHKRIKKAAKKAKLSVAEYMRRATITKMEGKV